MKRVANFALAGAFVFGLAATLFGPGIITWFDTPAHQPAMLSCQAAVAGAMNNLVKTQLICTAIGIVAGVVLGIVFRRKDAPAMATAQGSLPAPAAATTPQKK